ncbi:MAG: hypothetical protein LBR86_01615, partial [Tannerella sp.]|nr:hypothetical protein [Tannerella sp.]
VQIVAWHVSTCHAAIEFAPCSTVFLLYPALISAEKSAAGSLFGADKMKFAKRYWVLKMKTDVIIAPIFRMDDYLCAVKRRV